MPKLYRVENLITNQGLWYNSSDQSASNVAKDLQLSNLTLPMEPTAILSRDQWKSAAASIEQLSYWFTKEDLQKLIPLGFKLYEILATVTDIHTTELYSHPIFQERGVITRVPLDIRSIYAT